MKLKLKRHEFKTLLKEVGEMVTAKTESGFDPLGDEALSFCCLLSFYQKLFKKDTMFLGDKYSIEMSPADMIAFYQWFCDYPIDKDIYTFSLISRITNTIHQAMQTPNT